jgi:hypothetical protein
MDCKGNSLSIAPGCVPGLETLLPPVSLRIKHKRHSVSGAGLDTNTRAAPDPSRSLITAWPECTPRWPKYSLQLVYCTVARPGRERVRALQRAFASALHKPTPSRALRRNPHSKLYQLVTVYPGVWPISPLIPDLPFPAATVCLLQ